LAKNQFTINARDVYRKLEVGRDFSSWIKGRIGKEFKRSVDFVIVED
jgi:phage anti-repressor protein